MTNRSQFDASLLVWMISGDDFRIHAFYDAHPESGNLVALCPHSVPPDRIVGPEDTLLTPARCMKCQQRLVDILSPLLNDDTEQDQ